MTQWVYGPVSLVSRMFAAVRLAFGDDFVYCLDMDINLAKKLASREAWHAEGSSCTGSHEVRSVNAPRERLQDELTGHEELAARLGLPELAVPRLPQPPRHVAATTIPSQLSIFVPVDVLAPHLPVDAQAALACVCTSLRPFSPAISEVRAMNGLQQYHAIKTLSGVPARLDQKQAATPLALQIATSAQRIATLCAVLGDEQVSAITQRQALQGLHDHWHDDAGKHQAAIVTAWIGAVERGPLRLCAKPAAEMLMKCAHPSALDRLYTMTTKSTCEEVVRPYLLGAIRRIGSHHVELKSTAAASLIAASKQLPSKPRLTLYLPQHSDMMTYWENEATLALQTLLADPCRPHLAQEDLATLMDFVRNRQSHLDLAYQTTPYRWAPSSERLRKISEPSVFLQMQRFQTKKDFEAIFLPGPLNTK